MRKALRSLRSVIQLGLIPSQSVTAAEKIFIEAVKRGKIGQHTPQRLYSTGGWKVSQRGIEEDQNKHRLRKKYPGDTSEAWKAAVWSGTWCVSRRLLHIFGKKKKNLHFIGPKEACALKLDEEKRWKACLWVPLRRSLFIVLLIWALVSHQDKSRWANLPMNNLAQHSLCVCVVLRRLKTTCSFQFMQLNDCCSLKWKDVSWVSKLLDDKICPLGSLTSAVSSAYLMQKLLSEVLVQEMVDGIKNKWDYNGQQTKPSSSSCSPNGNPPTACKAACVSHMSTLNLPRGIW